MLDKQGFHNRIKSNIEDHGYHLTIVIGGLLPRYAYTIGLSESMGFEIVFAGGYYFSNQELEAIFAATISRLRTTHDAVNVPFQLENLGGFALVKIHASWCEKMLLGVNDYYADKDTPAYQILPDPDHFTKEIPRMDQDWSPDKEPVWLWIDKEWDLPIPVQSHIATTLEVLKGAKITEVSRWEEDYWEMWHTPVSEIAKSEIRIVPMATMLGLDATLFPATQVEVGKGVWREGEGAEWIEWG